MSLFKIESGKRAHPRSDLFSYAAMDVRLAHGILGSGRFASTCHSAHGEWFIGLAIPRTPAMPFDNIDDRAALEERLHALLSADGLGGVAGAGHGTENVYIDLALTDVARGLARIAQDLASMPDPNGARILLMDAGLTHLDLPLGGLGPLH